MRTIFLMALTISAFGCATGQYDPRAGECERSGTPLLNQFSSDYAYYYCLEQRAKIEAQKEHEERLQNDPEYAKEEAQRLKGIQDQKIAEERAEKAKEELYRNKHRVAAVGVSLEEFTKYHGEPNTKEIRDGKQVYWYDYQVPIFVIFTKNKISDIIIDRDTIQRRKNEEAQLEQNRAAERRHQQNLNEAQAAREQAYWNSFTNSLTNSINNSRPITTDCKRDYYGNITCTSY